MNGFTYDVKPAGIQPYLRSTVKYSRYAIRYAGFRFNNVRHKYGRFYQRTMEYIIFCALGSFTVLL